LLVQLAQALLDLGELGLLGGGQTQCDIPSVGGGLTILAALAASTDY